MVSNARDVLNEKTTSEEKHEGDTRVSYVAIKRD